MSATLLVNALLETFDLDNPEQFLNRFEPRFYVVAVPGPMQPTKTYWGGRGGVNYSTGVGLWHSDPLHATPFTQAEAESELEYLIQNYIDLGRDRAYGESRVAIEMLSPDLLIKARQHRARLDRRNTLRKQARQRDL